MSRFHFEYHSSNLLHIYRHLSNDKFHGLFSDLSPTNHSILSHQGIDIGHFHAFGRLTILHHKSYHLHMWFSQSPIENHFFVTPHRQIRLPNIFWKSEMGLGWTKTQEFFLHWSSTCPFPSSRLWNSFLQNNPHFHICIYPGRVLILFRRIPRKKLLHFCIVCLLPRNSYASIDHNTYKSD